MDFYSDQGAFLVKLLHDQSVPDFVKTSGYETEESVNSLPDSAFADQENRLFPIHTAADVYVSAAYMHGKQASISPVFAAQLEKAAVLFGVDQEVASVTKVAADYLDARTKTAAPEGRWEFQTKTATFGGWGEEHLKVAAQNLNSTYLQYSVEERTEIAQGLQRVAQELGAPEPAELEKFAGTAHMDTEMLRSEFEARALTLHEKRDVPEFLGKIAALTGAAEITSDEAMAAVEFLEEFDKQAGLQRFYGTRFSDPHGAVFNTPRAEHERKTATVTIGDVKHKYVDLMNYEGDIFEGILGRKVADVRELASLGAEEARVLNQAIA